MSMKKFLLFAAAALIVGSASALPYNKKKATSKVQLSQVKKTAPEASQAPGKLMAKSVIDFSKVRSLDKKTIKSINPVKKFANSRSNRAASLTSNYTGTAINYSSKEQEIWTMSPGIFEDETPCLVNVIPSPFGEGEENSIAVSYTVDGNKIKVPQQYVCSVKFTDGTEGFMWAVNVGTSVEDGSLNFTLSDDGSLTYDNYYSSYVVFSTNEVNWDNALNFIIYTNVKYVKEGVVAAPEVMYEPTGLYLHAFMDRDRQWFGETNYSVIPAYASVGFKNYTTDLADAWSWSVSTAEDTPTTETGNDRDFSFNSTGGMAYTPAELVGSNQGVASAPYKWGLVYECTQGYLFAGEMQSSFGDYMILGRSNPDNSYAYYSFLGTPDVNSQNYSIEQLILYQGQPSAPFYFEGISLFVKDFQIKDEANFNLKCKIVKVSRSEDNNLTIGDVIAEADIDTEEIYQNEDGQTTLYWTQFYKEDEEGMSVDVDYLMLDEEFAVIIDGWDNNTFSAIPFGEYEGNAVGSISTFGKDTGDDKIYTYASGNMLMGFVEGTYGYLHTTDNTSVTIPAEGGQAAIHIVPMLYSVDGDTGEPKTRLFLDEVEGNEVPSWLTVGFANEVYTENESSFDLVFQAEASTEARSCTLVFMQEGAKLEVTVSQAAGSGSGISTVVSKIDNNAPAYNVAGQRVNKNFKGLVVKDGRKFMNK